MPATVDTEKCDGCGECVEACPVDGIEVKDGKAVVDEDTCIDCSACEAACPNEAIQVA